MKLITVTNKDTNRTIYFNSALKVAYDGCHKIYRKLYTRLHQPQDIVFR